MGNEPLTAVGKDARGAVTVAIVVVGLTYASLGLPRDVIQLLAGREMVFETLGAVVFLIAAVGFFVAYRRSSGKASAMHRLAYGLLGLLFVVACGEELSWGQHLLGFETPERLRSINAQEEFNLHNLSWLDSYDTSGNKKRGYRAWLNSNRLFDYFMATLLWLIPMGYRWVGWLRPLLLRLGTPILTPIWGLTLLTNVGASAVAELLWVDGAFRHLAVSETRELNYAVVCALIAWWLARSPHEPRAWMSCQGHGS